VRVLLDSLSSALASGSDVGHAKISCVLRKRAVGLRRKIGPKKFGKALNNRTFGVVGARRGENG
jgi:hypothetical protein